MTTSTTTTDAEFRMGTKALLAAALARTDSGNLTIGAKRARNEIARRDAKNAAPAVKAAPVVKITPAQVAAVAKAAKAAGLGSRGGDLRKRLASEAARDANGAFSRDRRNAAYAIALTMTDDEVKADLRDMGFVVA